MASKKTCPCIKAVDAKLAESNGRISRCFSAGFSTGGGARMELSPPMIVTEKIVAGLRKKPPLLVASHCPFCGTAYARAAEGSQ